MKTWQKAELKILNGEGGEELVKAYDEYQSHRDPKDPLRKFTHQRLKRLTWGYRQPPQGDSKDDQP